MEITGCWLINRVCNCGVCCVSIDNCYCQSVATLGPGQPRQMCVIIVRRLVCKKNNELQLMGKIMFSLVRNLYWLAKHSLIWDFLINNAWFGYLKNNYFARWKIIVSILENNLTFYCMLGK